MLKSKWLCNSYKGSRILEFSLQSKYYEIIANLYSET